MAEIIQLTPHVSVVTESSQEIVTEHRRATDASSKEADRAVPISEKMADRAELITSAVEEEKAREAAQTDSIRIRAVSMVSIRMESPRDPIVRVKTVAREITENTEKINVITRTKNPQNSQESLLTRRRIRTVKAHLSNRKLRKKSLRILLRQ